MKEKKFIAFKIATLVALGISLGMFVYFLNEEFSYKKGFKDIWFDLISSFVFLLILLFQFLHVGMTNFLIKNNLPKRSFKILHTILLICNSICVIGIISMLCEILFDFFNKVDTNPNLLPIIIFLTWTIANSITIISSLRLRKYLSQQHETKEQLLLESFGHTINN